MRIVFVSAADGSRFMLELLEVVAHAVHDIGIDVAMHQGAFPADDGETVHVVIPHEYFVLSPEATHPTAEQLQRTIGFCVEHPGNATFETTAMWAGRLGGAVDINRDSCDELARRGVPVQRFTLGYSPLWDRWHGDSGSARGIDVTYLGTTDRRRDQLLARQARTLGIWRTALLIPPHEQMTRDRPDFLTGASKHRHLMNSKVLLNLHRGASRALEWVRVLEAMCNGCVVVSEHSTDFEPLVPGEHIAFAAGHRTVAVVTSLLRHPERLAKMRDSAYALCHDHLSMRDSAIRLVEMADWLMQGRPPTRSYRPLSAGPRAEFTSAPEPAPADPGLPKLAPWAEAIPPDVRSALGRAVGLALDHLPVEIETHQYPEGSLDPVVDVIVVRSGSTELDATIRSVDGCEVPARVLIATGAVEVPGFATPQGRMRNALLARCRSDLVLVIDPGEELLAGSLSKLVAALADDRGAAAAYGMVADPRSGTLSNALPAEVERLRRRVYLGTPLLVRRERLVAAGGYTEEPVLAGFEDHELYLRLAAGGHRCVLVPEIVCIRTAPLPTGVGLASLLPERAHAALERAGRGSSTVSDAVAPALPSSSP